MLREIGYKDRNYYYKDIRNIRGEVIFHTPVDVDALKRAAKKALDFYPHFAVCPVIKNGGLYYEDNKREIVIVPEDGKSRYFGTDDTNGYLFYLKYQDNKILISEFHGLADHGGFTPFFRNILYYYIKECGGNVPDIRVGEYETDELDAYDPYAKYADANAVPSWEYTDPSKIFILPADNKENTISHHYGIHISTKQFIDLTHEWETSFVPALISLISGTIAEIYELHDESVVAYTTVDMRPVFGSKNQTNFSEVIVMPENASLRQKDRKSQCKELRAALDAQKTRENFSRIMASLISSVKKAERTEDENPCRVILPLPTYLLTYPGRVEFPEGYEKWIKELNFGGANGNMGRGIAVMAKTTGDDMQIDIGGIIDVKPVCEKLTVHLTELGFMPVLTYLGEVNCDKYSVDRLKNIS